MAPTKEAKKLNFLSIIKVKIIKEHKLHQAQLAATKPHK